MRTPDISPQGAQTAPAAPAADVVPRRGRHAVHPGGNRDGAARTGRRRENSERAGRYRGAAPRAPRGDAGVPPSPRVSSALRSGHAAVGRALPQPDGVLLPGDAALGRPAALTTAPFRAVVPTVSPESPSLLPDRGQLPHPHPRQEARARRDAPHQGLRASGAERGRVSGRVPLPLGGGALGVEGGARL